MASEDLRSRLDRAVDEETLKRFVEEARSEGTRDEAVAFLKALWERGRDARVFAVLEQVCTGPEIRSLPRPLPTTVGPEHDAMLPCASYPRLLPGAPAFPFAYGSTLYMLAVAGPLIFGIVWLMRLAGCFGLAFMAPFYGFLMAYLFDVVASAAEGRRRAPRLKTVLWTEDSRLGYLGHFGRWLVATIVPFAPMTILLSAFMAESGTSRTVLLWLAVAAGAVGLVHYPVALLQAAFGDWKSPFFVIRGMRLIRRLGRDYALCAGFFVVTTAASTAFLGIARDVSGEMVGRRMVADALGAWVTYAVNLMQMRALGLLCWARRDDAGGRASLP